ncbi:tripartite tricarboxylate transporter permease [Paracoccus sp. Z330]|uniref:Tripartite tricarboxylate transporter permease n=1 Tax=Paracoccus onchidii TaxID=3017813 RepID=A0ABT4ZD93_9RHOB|nr:tripartite tricarboxylate transporter permease [Paracoccus onchidii]MDB6177260.1 tripartite tricarboxylate transporter permease [Paracoccus onchidii]
MLIDAIAIVLRPDVLLAVLGAGFFGMFIGAIPGLTASMATALLVPVTFFMAPVPAVASIVAATGMAIFAGDIAGTLMRMPGTPASAAYVDDAYALNRQGKANEALGACLLFSAIGGILGTAVLSLLAPQLAEVALKFSSFEYFWLVLLGLSSAVFVSSSQPLLGLVSLFIGLSVALIGQNNPTGAARYTFGSVELLAGVQFVPAMIGIFAVAEVIRSYTKPAAQARQARVTGPIFRSQVKNLRRYPKQVLRGASLGTIIGALPGAGADIAAWVSYALAKKFSRHPEKFGSGHPEGLVEAGASNNAAVSGAWIPALVFGIPGDTITAIVIGVMFVKGLNPGPMIFIQQPEMVYAIFLIFVLANVLMLPIGWLAIHAAGLLLSAPTRILMPIILLFCIVGSFSINNSLMGVGIMLAFGIAGYIMEENDIPLAPAILGLVLGPMIEKHFVTSMIKADGNLLAFFERPIAAALGILTVATFAYPLLRSTAARRVKG